MYITDKAIQQAVPQISHTFNDESGEANSSPPEMIFAGKKRA